VLLCRGADALPQRKQAPNNALQGSVIVRRHCSLDNYERRKGTRFSANVSHHDMARHVILNAGAAGSAMALSGSELGQQPAQAQQTPPVKGPLVWLQMDQAELDAAYEPSVWAPNLLQILKRYASTSEDVRMRLGTPQRYAYGAAPIERLDVYLTKLGSSSDKVDTST